MPLAERERGCENIKMLMLLNARGVTCRIEVAYRRGKADNVPYTRCILLLFIVQ
jgi:hypothetical protein